MRHLLRRPIVAFAAAADRIRRLPGSSRWGGGGRFLGPLLLVAAVIAFVAWGATPAPQRISLEDLSHGKLSPMQSWVIVSGVLREESSLVPGQLEYRLTDRATPDASLIVYSDLPLATGPTTISGSLQGGRDQSYDLRPWVGTLIADPTLARELPPPWLAIALLVAAVLVIAARRTRYPVFFPGGGGTARQAGATVDVEIRRQGVIGSSEPSRGRLTVSLDPEPRVSLGEAGGRQTDLRIHSQYTNARAGDLEGVGWWRPAILMRQPTDDLLLVFGSEADRDLVYATVRDDARTRLLPFAEGTRRPSQGSDG